MWDWVNSGSWGWMGRPGVLRFMGSQRVGHDWATELIWMNPYCIVHGTLLDALWWPKWERNQKTVGIYYGWFTWLAVQQKLTQQSKATIFQLIRKRKKKKKKNRLSDLSSLTNHNRVLTRSCGDLFVHQGLRGTDVGMPQSRIAELKRSSDLIRDLSKCSYRWLCHYKLWPAEFSTSNPQNLIQSGSQYYANLFKKFYVILFSLVTNWVSYMFIGHSGVLSQELPFSFLLTIFLLICNPMTVVFPW